MNTVRELLSRAHRSLKACAVSALQTLRHRVNDPDGVRARYLDLRLTSTKLIVGCGKATVWYSLSELAARVAEATDGNSMYLLIDGPGYTVRRALRHPLDSRAGARAWKFAQAVNYVASERGSVRAASAWVDAHGVQGPEPCPSLRPLLPRRRRRNH
jgi:hypothetical protein